MATEYTLPPLDLALIGLYGIVRLRIGWRLAGKHHTAEDYFLAGRGMPYEPVTKRHYKRQYRRSQRLVDLLEVIPIGTCF